jgi:hypothetical protein
VAEQEEIRSDAPQIAALGEIPEDYHYAEPGITLPSRTEQEHIAFGRAIAEIRACGHTLRQQFEKLLRASESTGVQPPQFDPHVQAAWEAWLRGPKDETPELEVPEFVRQ